MAGFSYKCAGVSHVGMRRLENQDSYLLAPDISLFIVADGMGGHQGGQTASTMAVQVIYDFFAEHRNQIGNRDIPPSDLVQNAILKANVQIQERGREDSSLQGMGTTTTLFYFHDQQLFIGHVGDSRAYLAHPHRVWQLTRDHSLVQEKLRAGLITRPELKTDRMKNVITRSVGFETEVDVDVYQMETHPGDVFLLCSDGLSGMVDDSDILRIIDDAAFRHGRIDLAAERLIEAANHNGGDDNVTAVLVQLEAPEAGGAAANHTT